MQQIDNHKSIKFYKSHERGGCKIPPLFRIRGVVMLSLFCSLSIIACQPSNTTSNIFDNGIKVVEVYDGDTVKILYPGLPDNLATLSVRIRGIDTPEIRGKCKREKEKAMEARDFVRKIIENSNNEIVVNNLEWDKYGGRILADAYIIEKTTVGYAKVNIADMVIEHGYGRKYDGKQRNGWCD